MGKLGQHFSAEELEVQNELDEGELMVKRNLDGSLRVIGHLPQTDDWLRGPVHEAALSKAKELGRPLTDKEVEAIKAQFAE